MEEQLNVRLNCCQNRLVQISLRNLFCCALCDTMLDIGIALKVKVNLVFFVADGAHQLHSRAAVSAHEL